MRIKLFRKTAFTLAEILITLGIIGIIAALTIPLLMIKTNSKETVAALRKSYAVLSQAYLRSTVDNGPVNVWNLSTTDPLSLFVDYLNIAKNCGTGQGCFSDDDYMSITSDTWGKINRDTGRGKIILADGSSVAFFLNHKDCDWTVGSGLALGSACGSILVDVNGFKGPNTFGKDTFFFYITNRGIIPGGSKQESDTYFSFQNGCKINTCTETTSCGYGCTSWVLENENEDYIKCSANLSWNGNHTCP